MTTDTPADDTSCSGCGHAHHGADVECEASIEHGPKHWHRCLCLARTYASTACPPPMHCQGGALGYTDVYYLQRGHTVIGPGGRLITPDVLKLAPWVDGDPLHEAIAAAIWERCATDLAHSLTCDDPRNIAAVAATVARRVLGTTEQADTETAPSVALLAKETPLGHSTPSHHVLGWCSHCPGRSVAEELAAWQVDALDRALGRADEMEQLRTKNERMRHELEVMYGGAFDRPKPAPAVEAQQPTPALAEPQDHPGADLFAALRTAGLTPDEANARMYAYAGMVLRQEKAVTAPTEETPDTLAPWLYQRFMVGGAGWDHLDEDDRSYWEHHAQAVRRAVARGGFKDEPTPAPAEETKP